MPRPQVYEHFGPEMIHAIVILIVEQLNVLRAKAGMPVITKEQVETALKTRFDELTADIDFTTLHK
ncbi:MAG: hypothetical protein A2Y89_02680 [Chloroflexi bacterium RBG_13_51_18]|nr:MAG: hypothetical protein A2Y89_02680 [Chloroflexi bacterium RBG_13_51_18]